jgi:hypothetical protein
MGDAMWWKLFAGFEMVVTYHNITTPLNKDYTWLDWLSVGVGTGACLLVACYAFDKRFYNTRAARAFLYVFVAYLAVTKLTDIVHFHGRVVAGEIPLWSAITAFLMLSVANVFEVLAIWRYSHGKTQRLTLTATS